MSFTYNSRFLGFGDELSQSQFTRQVNKTSAMFQVGVLSKDFNITLNAKCLVPCAALKTSGDYSNAGV